MHTKQWVAHIVNTSYTLNAGGVQQSLRVLQSDVLTDRHS